MVNTACINVDTQEAFAALLGIARPVFRAKLLTHLAVVLQFFNADGICTVDEDSAQLEIVAKNSALNAPALLDLHGDYTGAGATAKCTFEWASAYSAALIAALDASADPAKETEFRWQLNYSYNGKAATIGGPIYFENNFIRPDDTAPDLLQFTATFNEANGYMEIRTTNGTYFNLGWTQGRAPA